MSYDSIIIDSITCEAYNEAMYDETDSRRRPLLGLQEVSGNRVANKEEGVLAITAETKEALERKYDGNSLPISISCLIGACEEINILSIDENDSIIKAASFLKWKKQDFCVITGNSLLKTRLSALGFEVYDLSDAEKVYQKFNGS